jgi:hypothetical protein
MFHSEFEYVDLVFCLNFDQTAVFLYYRHTRRVYGRLHGERYLTPTNSSA